MVRVLTLEDRGVLEVSGPDAETFLNGLITNDAARSGPGRAVYAALLTAQGKYLFDFFVFRRDDGFRLDVSAARAADLVKRLALYRLRAKVTITDVSADWTIAVFDGPPGDLAPDAAPDPRHPALGWRAPVARGAPPIDLPPWPRSDYRDRMLDHTIPDHERDLVAERTFPMDANFDVLNGVDFRKGCYVGQELTARMKHRGGQRKRLVLVRVRGEAPPAGTPILAGGREIGAMATGQGGRALATLRLDKWAEAAAAGAPLEAGAAIIEPQEPAPERLVEQET